MQYLPHLLRDVVAALLPKVNYTYGGIQDIAKELSDRRMRGDKDYYPLVVLPMPFAESLGLTDSATVNIWIMDKTKPGWTMEQREQNSLFPRLMPVYEGLMNQFGVDARFSSNIKSQHTRIYHPYWGANEAKTIFQDNMFDETVDMLEIKDLKLTIYEQEDCIPFKS